MQAPFIQIRGWLVTDTIELGGHIELTGFSEVDKGKMVVLKKIIGNYARKFSEKSTNFEKLSLTVKIVHETEASKMYELQAHLIDNGQQSNAELTERNIFVAVDSVLKKIDNHL